MKEICIIQSTSLRGNAVMAMDDINEANAIKERMSETSLSTEYEVARIPYIEKGTD